MGNGKEFVGAHEFRSTIGKNMRGEGLCDTCALTESEGNHIPTFIDPFRGITDKMDVHEYEEASEPLINFGDSEVIREFCGVCGKPERDRLHFHEFKLVFGGYNCQVCGGLISDEVHKGVDPEGITERPVRELVETKSDDEFWVDEDKKVRPRIFGRNKDGQPALHYLPEEVINIDELVENADESKYFKHEALMNMSAATPITTKKKSVFTTGDKFVVGSIIGAAGLNIVAAAVNIVASIIN